MIELNEEQTQQLDSGKAIEVADPATARLYVILRKDVYDRAQHLLFDDSEWTEDEMRLQLAQSAKDNGWDEPGMEAYDRYRGGTSQAMPVNRGDVILAYVPNVGSPGGKVRNDLAQARSASECQSPRWRFGLVSAGEKQ